MQVQDAKMDTVAKAEVPPVQPVTLAWASTLVLGMIAGTMIGWVVRGVMEPPAPPIEHPVAKLQRKPTVILKPTQKVEPIAELTSNKPSKPNDGKPSTFSTNTGKAETIAPPMPPIRGNLPPLSPVGPNATATATPIETQPVADLHSLEAKVRVMAAEAGGRVLNSRKGSGGGGVTSLSLVLSVPQEKADELSEKIRIGLGDRATVSDPEPTAPSDTDELTGEQAALEALKKKLHDAQLSFYPDAPALKSMTEQVADQQKKVDALQKTEHLPYRLSVVLTSQS